MNKLQLVLKRTLFYPAFLMFSSGLFLLDIRGIEAVAAAAMAALLAHALINGYDLLKEYRSRQS